MDRLEAMRIFLATVETGSLSAAGRKLAIPLPTVSRKLSELEAHLNAQLMTRSTRKLLLTDAGAAYLTACRNILEQVGEAERAAAGEYGAPKGELVIAAPIVFGRLHVLPVLIAFLAAFPEIDARLRLSDRNADLIDDHIDLAVRIGELPDSSATASRVGEVRRITCASPTYLASHGVPKSPRDLQAHHCVTFEGLGSSTSWHFVRKGTRRPELVAVAPRLTVTTAEAAVDAAIAGVGFTQLLSYQISDHIIAGRLKRVLEDFAPPPVPVSLIHLGRERVATKIRAFADFAAPRLRRRLRTGVSRS